MINDKDTWDKMDEIVNELLKNNRDKHCNKTALSLMRNKGYKMRICY